MNKKFFGTKYFGLMKQKLNCLVATTKNIYLENKGKAFEERLSVIKHRGGPRLFEVTVCGTGNIVQILCKWKKGWINQISISRNSISEEIKTKTVRQQSMERFQYIAHSRIFKHTSELEEFCKEKWKKTPKVQTEKKS